MTPMEPPDPDNMADERDTGRGFQDSNPTGMSSGVLKTVSLLMVLALVLAGGSVIIFNTDNGLWVILLIVAIAAVILYRWGFRSRSGQPGDDR
jgi:hypothetical protein